MKSLIKKNQLMITALAIMIAIAGYLQMAGENLEGEYLGVDEGNIATVADNSGIITENYTAEQIAEVTNMDGLMDLSEEDLLPVEGTEIQSLDSDLDVMVDNYLDEDMQVSGTEIEAEDDLLSQVTPQEGEIPGEAVFTAATNVLSEAKLLKEQTRAKNKETLLDIINSEGLTDGQKQSAVDSMVQMTEYAEKEAAAEILLEAKGFTDVVVSISAEGVDVVVNATELTDAQRAQIEDIVTRKTNMPAENIVISTVKSDKM